MGEVDRDAARRGHETRDLSAAAIALFGVVLVVAVAISQLALKGMFGGMERGRQAADVPPSAHSGSETQIPPPRIESLPRLELRDLRAAEDRVLSTYGWVDRSKGVVHIPLARALELTAAKGLPSRAAGAERPAGVSSSGGPAAAGRPPELPPATPVPPVAGVLAGETSKQPGLEPVPPLPGAQPLGIPPPPPGPPGSGPWPEFSPPPSPAGAGKGGS